MAFVIHLIASCWTLFCQMSWPLMLGYFAAGLISQFIRKDFVQRELGGKGFLQILKAVLVGIPLPLCSCGVIPVAESLRKMGTGKGAVTAFLISTPQTGIDSVAVTWGVMGPFLAFFRVAAAFFSGIAGGVAVDFFGGPNPLPKAEPPEENKCCCCEKRDEIGDEKQGSAAGAAEKQGRLSMAFSYGFTTLLGDSANSIAAGIVIGGVISALVPDGYFLKLGAPPFVQMLLMMLFGIPLYVCASASVPIAASLIAKGVSPGAAFVFLITGPATNTVAAAAMIRMTGLRATMVYFASIAATSLISGFVIDLFPPNLTSQAVAHCMADSMSPLQHAGGILFLLLLARAKIILL